MPFSMRIGTLLLSFLRLGFGLCHSPLILMIVFHSLMGNLDINFEFQLELIDCFLFDLWFIFQFRN